MVAAYDGACLNLAYKKLHAIPPEIKSLKGLKEIDLTATHIAVVPEGILPPTLEVLTITGNDVAGLPTDLPRLPCLTQLYAGTNRIADADAVFLCPKLMHAGLSFNSVAKVSVPPEAAAVSPLFSLDLSHNDLASAEELALALAPLGALRSLSVAGNPLCLAPGWREALLLGLPQLQTLDNKPVEGGEAESRPPSPPAPDGKEGGEGEGGESEPAGTLEEGFVYLQVEVADVVPVRPPPPPPPPEDEEGGKEEGEDDKDAPPPDPKAKDAKDKAPAPEEELEPLPPPEYHVVWSLGGGEGLEGRTVPVPLADEEPDEAPDPKAAAKKPPPPEAEASEGAGRGALHVRIPLDVAARDLLRDGVKFELVRREMVRPPPPPPPSAEPSSEEAAEGAGAVEGGDDKDKDAEEAAGEEEPPSPPEPVEVVTVVGEATVKLMSFVEGESVEASTIVELLPPPALFDGQGIFMALEDERHVKPAAGTAAVSFKMHVPLPPEPEEDAGEGEEEKK